MILVFLTIMLVTSFGRLYLIYEHKDLLPNESAAWALKSILRGLQFDSMIASWIIALPMLVLSLLFLFKIKLEIALAVFNYFFYLLFLVVVVMVVADLPFFEYYNSRLSKGILSWVDSPAQMLCALVDEDYYYVYYLIGFAAIIALFILNRFLYRRYRTQLSTNFSLIKRISMFFVFSFILFLGIRGNLDFSEKPLTSEKAFISNVAFVNQMAMNPIFNFFDSFRYTELSLENKDTAIAYVRSELSITEPSDCSPIARKIEGKKNAIKPNIVLILVESLSASKVSLMDQRENITPAIDSLAQHGLYFSNFYSNGVHTYNGIFSSLYALPVVWNKKPLSDSYLSQLKYSGLPEVLKQNGYVNSFFLTGDPQFDNMGSFLLDHGFDNVYSKGSYKAEDIRNSWGLPDHKLYDYFYHYMNNMSLQEKPLFTTLLTVSSHHGYDPPCVEDFSPTSNDYGNTPYEFADWSIKRFFKKASNEPWFDSTIFVIVGDHGQNFKPLYSLPLSYVHVPMIVYAPSLIQSRTIENMAMQLDIFPTLMGMTNLSYQNNTLGVDLLNEKRPFAYFSSDDYLGCIDVENYYLLSKSGREQFFDLSTDTIVEISATHQQKMLEKKAYLVNMMQTSQSLMNARQTGLCE